MRIQKPGDLSSAIQRLTGVANGLRDGEIKGRNVWGRLALMQDGMVHVEIMPGDEVVNDAVMPTISSADMEFGREQRRKVYRERCMQVAASMNETIIRENKLSLLVSSNGHLSKLAGLVIDSVA